ncbi:MAG: sigH 1 [Planctomycetaceae bacterium]|nr:sigH 1 [Planctomycetaceae bacterium]
MAASSLDLHECLTRARQGDIAARDRLFAACRSYVGLIARATLERRLQAKVDASDLVQQTLMDAHRDFSQFAGSTEQEWLAWLRKILAHNTGDAYRHFAADKRQIRREFSLQSHANGGSQTDSQGPGFDPASPGDTPSQIILGQEQELAVAEAISQLPDDYREVVFLRNVQRLPFDEVAVRMERSRPAVQMLWMRALHRLREILGEVVQDETRPATSSAEHS